MQKPTVASQVAAEIATYPNVEMAKAIGNTIVVRFPRERGGRYTLTLPRAKAMLAQWKEQAK